MSEDRNDVEPGTDELERLRQENHRLRRERDLYRQEHKLLAGGATLVLFGPRLVASLKAWLRKTSRDNPLPVDETAELGAAIIRRMLGVGFVGLFFAAILPTWLLWNQNQLLDNQNQLFESQNGLFARQNLALLKQFRSESEDRDIARRAQLLDLIYSCGEQVRGDDEAWGCEPAAHPMARKEAVEAFIEVETRRDHQVNLTHARLEGINLAGVNLETAVFLNADLTRAYLNNTDLSDGFLVGANLTGAHLYSADVSTANLREARLNRADFTDADLREANLSKADLSGARLHGADLRGAQLVQEQIDSAEGDRNTRLPEGLDRPAHWRAE